MIKHFRSGNQSTLLNIRVRIPRVRAHYKIVVSRSSAEYALSESVPREPNENEGVASYMAELRIPQVKLPSSSA